MRDGRPAKDSDESNKHIFETSDAHALMGMFIFNIL